MFAYNSASGAPVAFEFSVYLLGTPKMVLVAIKLERGRKCVVFALEPL